MAVGSLAILGATSARRSAAGGSADSADQSVFVAAVTTAINCFGAREIWAHCRGTVASATIGIRVAWYDVDDTFLFAEAERTFTADANETADGTNYLTQIEVYDIPGAYAFRLWIRTAASGGTFDLYAGVRP